MATSRPSRPGRSGAAERADVMFLRRLWTRFTEGAERRPADAEGYLREVRALAREGEYASAVELCREGLEQFQGNGPLHRLAREVRQAEREARRQALLTEVATAPTDAYRNWPSPTGIQ